jgi:hypothetical protein
MFDIWKIRLTLLRLALLLLLAALLVAPAQAAVVTRNGQGYVNANNTATNPVSVSEMFGAAHQKVITSSIAVGSTDSATSLYYVGNIPTNAIIDPASLVYSSGITGLTSMSCGFGANPEPANPLGTWTAVPAALVSAQDWHSSGSYSLVQAISTSNYAEQVWQFLGSTITLDPGGVVPVYCTVNTGPSGSGTLVFMLKYYDTK